jgi:23S rRNA U2552 (ribose-2'-O)-methylase RlmE/FtsJ
MEIITNGGPSIQPLVRWTGLFKYPPDRSCFRSPESRALQQCKNDIQKESKWDDFKKITNPYEYIFLSWNRRSSRSVAIRQPLSRSYFKMIEMWVHQALEQHLKDLVAASGGLRTAHSAEGPGGFIEAVWERAKKCGWSVLSTDAITLRSDARNIPGWRKAVRFLQDRPEIRIHEGADGTGNILLSENQDSYVSDVLAKTSTGVHLYTADGGFDFSSDYNAQEDSIFPLLLAEALLGLRTLCVGGCIVLKCFDTTEQATVDLLWILTLCFREISIVKPNTSRAGNAERYFVGKGRLPHIEDSIELLESIQCEKIWNRPLLEPMKDTNPMYAQWKDWLGKLFDLQEQIEHQEYTIIRKTLDLIHSHDIGTIRSLVRENVERSIEWCRTHEEPMSVAWCSELERNVHRESHDLIHILSPPHHSTVSSYHSWYSRTSSGTSLSFQGFRSDSVEAVYTNTISTNPFSRIQTT